MKNVRANSLVLNHKNNMMINWGIEHIHVGKGNSDAKVEVKKKIFQIRTKTGWFLQQGREVQEAVGNTDKDSSSNN